MHLAHLFEILHLAHLFGIRNYLLAALLNSSTCDILCDV